MDSSDTSEQKTRLPVFRTLVRFIAVMVGIFFGLYIFIFKDSLVSLRYPNIVVLVLLFGAAYTAIITLLEKYFKREKIFYVSNFGWMLVYLGIMYGTGGADSPYLFVLLVPLITSAWNLDPVVTRRIGVIMLSAGALMIFADPPFYRSINFILDYFLRLSALGIVMYYIYRLLKETLRQKYEKEEAKKKYDELLEIDRLKTDFVTVVSHQLRTPLTGARWGLSALLDGDDIASEVKPLLKQTQDRINDSIAIVNDMISSIDAESNSLKKAKRIINLDELVRGVVDKLRYFIDGNRTSLSFGEISPCTIEGSRDALSAAFSNIIDNAVRYSPGGNVSVSVVTEGGVAVITVRDSGIGIPPEDQPYIFKRFYRGKNAVKIEPNGSGIGLYLTKRIIEQHGGTISFSSELDKGTTVIIKLPLRAQPAA